MKIGILTFWETVDNYGQVLQGYALQEYLRSQGHEVFIIRYDHDSKYKINKISRNKQFKRFIKILMVIPILNYLLHYSERKNNSKRLRYNCQMNQYRQIDRFRDNYFEYSETLYLNLDSLQNNPPEADIYIVGSDQVWGWTLDKHDNRAFFLDFGASSVKRIAYAPSFAMEQYPERNRSELYNLLKRFNAISVREKTGVNICHSVGVDAEWVCDPTMLLEKKNYEKLTREREVQPYLFMYSINIEKKEEIFWDEIKSIAVLHNLQIKVTTSSGHIPANELFEGVKYDYATVEGWLSNIMHAEFVVTTSFHGVVFCILFNKNFAFVPLQGKYAKGNNRVIDLLNYLGLENSVVKRERNVETIYNSNIDWKSVNEKLNMLRQKSQNYLYRNIK